MGNILGWLDSLWNSFTGGLSGIWHWIIDAFKSVWSFIYKMYDVLSHGINVVAGALDDFAKQVDKFIVTGVDNLYHLALKWVTDLKDWAVREFDAIIGDINKLVKWAVNQVDNLVHEIAKAYNAIEHWVMVEIWLPLKTRLDSAINWIEQEGAYVYDLITHPEKLVTLIESYLMSAWLVWLRRLARPIAQLILQQFRTLAGELISVLEDVLTNIL